MANRKRGKSVLLRLSDEEFEKFMEKVNTSGLSQQEYLLKTATNKPILVIDGLDDLLEQLRKIGVNFNQLVKLANSAYIDDCSEELKGFSGELKNIWQLLRTTLSKPH